MLRRDFAFQWRLLWEKEVETRKKSHPFGASQRRKGCVEANYQRRINNKTICVDPICPVTLPTLAFTLGDLDKTVGKGIAFNHNTT